MNVLHLKFDRNELADLNTRCHYVKQVEDDYFVEGDLSEIARALVCLGLVKYV